MASGSAVACEIAVSSAFALGDGVGCFDFFKAFSAFNEACNMKIKGVTKFCGWVSLKVCIFNRYIDSGLTKWPKSKFYCVCFEIYKATG